MKKPITHNTRALAALVLTEILKTNTPIEQVLPKYKVVCKNDQDRSLLQAFCYGVLRWYPRLQFFMSKLLEKPFKPKDQDIYNLICVGLFQLQWMRIPPHAALSETVEGARALQKPWATGLINAVLRSFQRKSEAILKEITFETQPDAKTAHPIWFLAKIREDWPKDWQQIIEANNGLPPLSLRVNCRQISRDAYLQQLKTQEIEAKAIELTTAGIIIEKPCDVTLLPGYSEGFFSVQDGSSQRIVEYLDLTPGLRILDACSAPGGKLCLILETEPLLEVLAMEVSQEKIDLIHQNLTRLKLLSPKIKVQNGDSAKPDDWWDGKFFDRILCDAPCSATGVIRRHPDIKLLRHSKDIPRLAAGQLKLLKALWPLLKPGGLLLYTTCSIFKEENQDVIDSFCQGLPLNSFKQDIHLQVFPGQNDMDGFYYGRIWKIEP